MVDWHYYPISNVVVVTILLYLMCVFDVLVVLMVISE